MGGKINRTFNPVSGKSDDSVSKAELNGVLSKINLMKQDIERALSGANLSTIITQTINSGGGSSGGGSSSGSTVKNVSKAVTAGVTYAETFSASALLLTLPIVYVTDASGLMSSSFPPVTSLTVSGFSTIPIETGTMIYSYLLL